MNKRTGIGILVFVLIEACIISSFVHFWPADGDSTEMIIDIIVSTIIWGTFSIDIFRPLMDDEKNPRQAGSLGLRWFTTCGYAVLAIGIMVLSYKCGWEAFVSGIAQVAALVVLILGFWSVSHAGDKVQQVARQEGEKLAGRASMTAALRQLKNEAALAPQVPQYVKTKIDELVESMRFITTNSNPEAQALERQFAEEADSIRFALDHFEMNEETVNKSFQRMTLILTDRKNLLQ